MFGFDQTSVWVNRTRKKTVEDPSVTMHLMPGKYPADVRFI